MTDQERQEFRKMTIDMSSLKTDMALLHQSQEKIVEPTLATILKRMDDLSFYNKKEVDDKLNDIIGDIDVRIEEIQKKRWYENTVSALAGSVLTTVIGFIVLRMIGDV